MFYAWHLQPLLKRVVITFEEGCTKAKRKHQVYRNPVSGKNKKNTGQNNLDEEEKSVIYARRKIEAGNKKSWTENITFFRSTFYFGDLLDNPASPFMVMLSTVATYYFRLNNPPKVRGFFLD